MRGRALIIATSHYADPCLSSLQSTQIDAAGLRETLSDSNIGDLKVTECIDGSCQAWRENIEEFFACASPDELSLLYISGHAIKDRDGKLYFAASNTRTSRLMATGIPASFIQETSNNSRSRRIVMIFDTCFSGAFAKGVQLKSGMNGLNAGEYFAEGAGKIVITASDAMQYALAGDSIDGVATPSMFSKHVIHGLRTGDADVDGDGKISSADLFHYVSSALRGESAGQTPQRWCFGVTGDLTIARNPRPQPGALPDELLSLLGNSMPAVRRVAIDELAKLLSSNNVPIALAAKAKLERLREDDSRAIALAADEALAQTKRNAPAQIPTAAPLRVPVHLPATPALVYKTEPPRIEKRAGPTNRRINRKKVFAIASGLLGVVLIIIAATRNSTPPVEQLPTTPAETGTALVDPPQARPPTSTGDISSPSDPPASTRQSATPTESAGTTTQWTPGVPKPDSPHVIAGSESQHWTTEAGYTWVTEEEGDFRVAWNPGQAHPDRPHVVAGKDEGKWAPASGYTWLNDSPNDHSVVWRPGKADSVYPNVIAGEREGKFVAAPGFEWANPEDSKDFSVRPTSTR